MNSRKIQKCQHTHIYQSYEYIEIRKYVNKDKKFWDEYFGLHKSKRTNWM